MVPYLIYRRAPPAPARPVITNIAAYKVDIVWTPPGSQFDNLMVTGYKVIWFQPQFRNQVCACECLCACAAFDVAGAGVGAEVDDFDVVVIYLCY